MELIFSAIQDLEKKIELNETSNQERQRALFWIMVVVKFLIPLAGAYIAMGSLILLLPVSWSWLVAVAVHFLVAYV